MAQNNLLKRNKLKQIRGQGHTAIDILMDMMNKIQFSNAQLTEQDETNFKDAVRFLQTLVNYVR